MSDNMYECPKCGNKATEYVCGENTGDEWYIEEWYCSKCDVSFSVIFELIYKRKHINE